MFETPRLVLTPNFSLIIAIASRVIRALLSSEETVMARQSTTISLFLIPHCSARSTIFFARENLPSALSGIPFSSRVSAIKTPPYFLARGKTVSRLSSLALTEFIIGFPLYILKAFSMVSALTVSICNGKSVTD